MMTTVALTASATAGLSAKESTGLSFWPESIDPSESSLWIADVRTTQILCLRGLALARGQPLRLPAAGRVENHPN
jgi:hypothetical protein